MGNNDDDDDEEEELFEEEYYEQKEEEERHRLDADEQYIVDMLTKDELRRKVETDLKQRELRALNFAQDSYEQNLIEHEQQDSAIMDDIIREMNLREKEYGAASNQYYH